MRAHGRSRGCRYPRSHHRDGRPSRSRRHLHGWRCWRDRMALRGGRSRRNRDGRHLSGRRPTGRPWPGERLRRRHGSDGRGSWRRSRGRLCHGLRRPRQRSGNSPLHRSHGRRLRSPRGRCHRHLWPRSIRRYLLRMRTRHRHLLCARYRCLGHARLHARRARCHGYTRRHGSMLRSSLHWRSPRLNRCMVRSRRRVLRASCTCGSHWPCRRWSLNRRHLRRWTSARWDRRRCSLCLSWDGRQSRRPWRSGGSLLRRGRRRGVRRMNTRRCVRSPRVHSWLRHRNRTRRMGWLGCSRNGSGRQNRWTRRLWSQRGRGTRSSMCTRRRMGRSRGMHARRGMMPSRMCSRHRMGSDCWMHSRRRMSPRRGMQTRRRSSPCRRVRSRPWMGRGCRVRSCRRMTRSRGMRSRRRMRCGSGMQTRRRSSPCRRMRSRPRMSRGRGVRSRRRMSPSRRMRSHRGTCSRRRMRARCRMCSRWMARGRWPR